MEGQAILRNIQIQLQVDSNDLMSACDENQIKQVFINFLKNAMESMPDGGGITICIGKTSKGDIRIRMIDEGCGIPEELLKKVGQPFFTTKEEGTGLGLMISKKIVEMHGGTVRITSQWNVGTTVEVTLPPLAESV